MKIVSLEMQNFRQFLGDFAIEFSIINESPSTVIHGENGVGKTTILNAIFWCMYGQMLEEFEQPENLVNDVAREEMGVDETTVALVFEHEREIYRVVRNYVQSTQTTNPAKGFRIDGGNSVPIDGIEAVISRIIPLKMAPYFFFHGEGLNSFGATKGKKSFRDAIRSILGFDTADQTADILRVLHLKWQRDQAKLAKLDKASREAIEAQANVEEQIRKARQDLDQAKFNLSDIDDSIEDINQELAKIRVQNIDQLSDERVRLERREQILPGQVDIQEQRKMVILSKYGWSIFGHSFLLESSEQLQQFRSERKIPSEYNDRFINALLKSQVCICGAKLEENSIARQTVTEMLAGATTSEQEDAIIKAAGLTENIPDVASDYLDEVTKINIEIDSLESEKGSVKRRLEVITEQLGTIDRPRLRELEAERDDQVSLAKRLRDMVSTQQVRMKRLVKELDDAKRKKRKVVDPDLLGGYQARLNFLESLISLTEDITHREENSARIEIEELINEKLDKFSRKDYFVEVREDFSFVLRKQNGQSVAKSKGEKTLLNLSFISALIQLAKSRANETSDFFVQGTVAPFVIDAPFGELDNQYRGAVAKFLPESTDQLVTLLSSSHWGHSVEVNIRPSVGVEYVLVSESRQKNESGEKTVDRVRIADQMFECTRYDMAQDRSVIERV